MNDINRGKLCALRRMLEDSHSQVRQATAAEILGEVLNDEEFELNDLVDWEHGGNLSDWSDPASRSYAVASGVGRVGQKESDIIEEMRAFGREYLAEDRDPSEAIRTIREQFGLLQGEFARIIGSSPATMSRALTGNQKSMQHVLAAMAEFFGE